MMIGAIVLIILFNLGYLALDQSRLLRLKVRRWCYKRGSKKVVRSKRVEPLQQSSSQLTFVRSEIQVTQTKHEELQVEDYFVGQDGAFSVDKIAGQGHLEEQRVETFGDVVKRGRGYRKNRRKISVTASITSSFVT